MKIKEEIEMFFAGMLGFIYWIIYMGSAMFIVIPFYSLYNIYKTKGDIDKYDYSILLIEIPAVAAFLIIKRLMKKRNQKGPMEIDNDKYVYRQQKDEW